MQYGQNVKQENANEAHRYGAACRKKLSVIFRVQNIGRNAGDGDNRWRPKRVNRQHAMKIGRFSGIENYKKRAYIQYTNSTSSII